MAVKRDPNLRAFVKVDKLGQVVPSSLILRRKPPEGGRSHYWIEIESNVCCSIPISNWEYTDASVSQDGLFTITVNGSLVVSATNTEAGTFSAAGGDTVAISSTGTGPSKTLLVLDDTTGFVLSNQTGTTGALTYTYVAPALHVYSVIATQNPTTTTTTTTTSTSTTSTSTTSTSTTSTTSTTTTSTTGAAGSFTVTNLRTVPSGVTITGIGPANFTGGTYPVAASASTVSTISTLGVNVDITVSVAATSGNLGGATLSLYKNGAFVQSLGLITTPGTETFGPISFLTTDRLQVILS